jgi:hypothetical protein
MLTRSRHTTHECRAHPPPKHCRQQPAEAASQAFKQTIPQAQTTAHPRLQQIELWWLVFLLLQQRCHQTPGGVLQPHEQSQLGHPTHHVQLPRPACCMLGSGSPCHVQLSQLPSAASWVAADLGMLPGHAMCGRAWRCAAVKASDWHQLHWQCHG